MMGSVSVSQHDHLCV